MRRLILRSLPVLMIGALSSTAVSAQTITNGPGNTGNLLNYPSGTRIYQGGAITTPNGNVIYPNVTVPGGNGTNTYYYPDGSQVTTNSRTIAPSGSFLSPNSPNGGLSIPTVKPVQPLAPNRLNQR